MVPLPKQLFPDVDPISVDALGEVADLRRDGGHRVGLVLGAQLSTRDALSLRLGLDCHCLGALVVPEPSDLLPLSLRPFRLLPLPKELFAPNLLRPSESGSEFVPPLGLVGVAFCWRGVADQRLPWLTEAEVAAIRRAGCSLWASLE